jgi:16S rRNA processing protein RimM
MNAQARPQKEYVPLGFISGVYGVNGWVKVHSFTQPREALLAYQPWLLGPKRRRVEVLEGRRQGKTLVAALAGVADRDSAHELLNEEIVVPREQLPELLAGEYYWADLIGLAVETQDGTPLGTVERMMATGANDVLVVRGERERLIPFVMDQFVTRVDLAGGRLVVDWDPEF